MWEFLALENECECAMWHFDLPFNNITDERGKYIYIYIFRRKKDVLKSENDKYFRKLERG